MSKIYNDFSKFTQSRNIPSLTLDGYANHINNSYIDPSIIEERTRNITQMSVFSKLFMERILFLGSEINDDVANIINSQLLYLEMDNPEKPITIYVNSPGGSVSAGLSIYDLFNYVSCPITTTCMGTAASMGAVLLSSGDKGKRFALPHSQVMIHQPLGGNGKMMQASDIKINYEEIMKCKKTINTILAQNTGKPYDAIEEACDRDNWFTSSEAVDFGLIDEVIRKK